MCTNRALKKRTPNGTLGLGSVKNLLRQLITVIPQLGTCQEISVLPKQRLSLLSHAAASVCQFRSCFKNLKDCGDFLSSAKIVRSFEVDKNTSFHVSRPS